MEYRQLGKSGLKISALSYGAWVTFVSQMGSKEARQCMALAYDNGVNFFDNAEAYAAGEAEVLMGTLLADLAWTRDSFCVSSKVFWGGQKPTQRGLSRKHVFDACHAALKRLRLEYLDLYFCHRPDPTTPIEETVRAMSDLVSQGKVMYWGTSEWDARQIAEACTIARANHWAAPTMEQPQYNLVHRHRVEIEYAPLYRDHGLGTTIWSPLASGILTGKYTQGIPKDSRVNVDGYAWLKEKVESPDGQKNIAKAAKLVDLARALDITLPQLEIAWCLKNPHVSSVILGASKVHQLEETLKSVQYVIRLDNSIMSEIEKIVDNRPHAPEQFI